MQGSHHWYALELSWSYSKVLWDYQGSKKLWKFTYAFNRQIKLILLTNS